MADLERTLKNLQNRGFHAQIFSDRKQAADFLVQTLKNTSVGIGGSATIESLDVYDRLTENNEVFWHWKSAAADTREKAGRAESYICSANGLSETGEIVNLDGFGNRVSATIYGPQRIFIVVGKNKIAPDLESTIFRVRNVAAPLNARRLKMNTPCAKGELRCYDCRSSDRICRAMGIVLMPPTSVKEFHVLLVDEELGY